MNPQPDRTHSDESRFIIMIINFKKRHAREDPIAKAARLAASELKFRIHYSELSISIVCSRTYTPDSRDSLADEPQAC